ncbi:hypothetical protein [Gandjariella thermophila]|uniref:Uncharacterized protein n=1 Tax=Gandjariella thermophila TaxID=1931992 RepID=A0A4D4J810_9PSEU|nr:hypothetical protein [Gandjariella thermophila]GDY30097.1 hypothetical protein GTS_17300 [Gandjariella thermophila]
MSESFVIDADELLPPSGAVPHIQAPSAGAPDTGQLGPGSWGIASPSNHPLFPHAVRPATERAMDTIRKAAEAIEQYAIEAQEVANTCQDLEREIAGLLRELAADLDEPEPDSAPESRPEPLAVPVGALGEA